MSLFGLSWPKDSRAQISIEPIAPLKISTTADIPFANPGGEIYYTTTVTNESDQVLTSILVRHNWPSVLLDQGVVAGISSWTIDRLEPKSSQTRTFVFTVRDDAHSQVYQGSTNLTVVNPSWRLEALYTLEVRSVQVLSGALPDTSVPDKIYVLGFFIIIQMSLVATWALRQSIVSINHYYED